MIVTPHLTPVRLYACVEKWTFTLVNSHFLPCHRVVQGQPEQLPIFVGKLS